MQKLFRTTHAKIKPARLFESARGSVNKALKIERKKDLPDGMHYWDFDCLFGATKETATEIHVGDIKKSIDAAEKEGAESFYISISPRAVKRVRNTPVEETEAAPEADAESEV